MIQTIWIFGTNTKNYKITLFGAQLEIDLFSSPSYNGNTPPFGGGHRGSNP
jgi:hypothetical protein